MSVALALVIASQYARDGGKESHIVNINSMSNVVTKLGDSYLKVRIGNRCSIDWGIPGGIIH